MAMKLIILTLIFALGGCSCPDCPEVPMKDSSSLLGAYRGAMGKMVMQSTKQQERIGELEDLVGWYIERLKE